jgi:ArsR family transcriptional regulator
MQAAPACEIKDREMPPQTQPLSDDALKEIVQLFKLLADETRLKILHFLHQAGELNVLELCRRLCQRQPSVSHHLALLRVAGLIEMRRDGKHNYYRLQPKQFERLIATVFNAPPGSPFQLRFEDYLLRYDPIDGNGE